MPPTPQPDKDDAHQQLLDQMDIYYLQKPFRTSNWKPGRNKNLKQILSEASRREASVMATQNNSGASTPLPPPYDASGTTTPQPNMAQATQSLSTLVLERNLQKAANLNGSMSLGYNLGPAVTYTNIESAPSLTAAKKHYCDITGLPARYTDPKTKLRYCNQEIFGVTRTLPPGGPDQYLAARGANCVKAGVGRLSLKPVEEVVNLDYFQRIKGAIDNRIAEEQARQTRLQQQQTRQTPRKRPGVQDGSTQRVVSQQRATTPGEKGTNPDPSEFEPDFAIGTDESAAPSRVATPRPQVNPGESEVGKGQDEKQEHDVNSKPTGEDESSGKVEVKDEYSTPKSVAVTDIPPDVKVRLRKLDKLESKYAELLRAYRAAHAKVQIIEPFEAALRENTPLTTIAEPAALVEYLNQVNLKSEMVIDELKRVSTERDDFKKKSEQSEAEATHLRHEIVEQKKKLMEESRDVLRGEEVAKNMSSVTEKDAPNLETVQSPKSTSSRVPSISFFSPKPKALDSIQKNASEDLFSYDSEIPRLESEVNDRQAQIEDLNKEIVALKGELKVAHESTESMVQTLERTTVELNKLKDDKDKHDQTKKNLEEKFAALQAEYEKATEDNREISHLPQLQRERDEAMSKLLSVEEIVQALEIREEEMLKQIKALQERIEFLNEKLSQKDHINKDLEDSLAMAKAAERDHAKEIDHGKVQEKKLTTMEGIMDQLRRQLSGAESTISELKQEIQNIQIEFAQKPSSKIFALLNEDEKLSANMESLQTRDEIVEFLSENLCRQKASAPTSTNGAMNVVESSASGGGKKKNKKKKKGRNATNNMDEVDDSMPIKVSEDLSQEQESVQSAATNTDANNKNLQDQISELKLLVDEKESSITRLSNQLKEQEALQEEIETLRDDLLHQGEEHVEARDKLKSAEAQRQILQETIEKLENEIADARKQIASSNDSDIAHRNLLGEQAQLQKKFTSLQTDLTAAEQIAAARFKDIADLKELLGKAQPELRALRGEVDELRSARDDLKNKTGELSRLEAKHEELKAEMKSLGVRFSEQDLQTKDLQLKIEQEAKMREKIEGELSAKQSEIRSAEARQKGAIEISERTTAQLAKVQEELTSLVNKSRALEEQLSSSQSQISGLREEVSIKTALHSSSLSLVQSLRDQSHELNVQAREASSRAENLEEELAEAQRMLSERTREGQTMRMLLNQSESGSEGRVREMKERLDAALEERDRVDDEASLNNRRMMREVDEAKSKARDAHRQMKILEDEKDELDNRNREWKRRREDLERTTEAAQHEVEEVRIAMKGLREALDESERQVREAESQRTDLRRQTDEANERIEKLSKANKNLTDEVKTLQSQIGGKRLGGKVGPDSGLQSSRTSIDSGTPRSPAPLSRTTTPMSRVDTLSGTGTNQGTVDYIYLKNVLLQFLTQKDKGHQRQLIPVLGMLLHFDQKDEQKWNAAISTR